MTASEATRAAGPAGNRIALHPKLDLKASDALARDLQSYRGEDLVVDASEVEQIGAHALQTLLVAARSWQADGRRFAVTGLSAAAAENLATMGVDEAAFEGGRTSR